MLDVGLSSGRPYRLFVAIELCPHRACTWTMSAGWSGAELVPARPGYSGTTRMARFRRHMSVPESPPAWGERRRDRSPQAALPTWGTPPGPWRPLALAPRDFRT